LWLLVDLTELKSLYKQFKRESPSGMITKNEFAEVMGQMGLVDPFLQEQMFRVFDTNHDDVINFQEFVTAWSIMSRGTPDEKLMCM
jgi:neuronal calcium sensor 1